VKAKPPKNLKFAALESLLNEAWMTLLILKPCILQADKKTAWYFVYDY
jgi:hypothetical protein